MSSIHKDHFENMYAVISGEKVFTLLPPTDVAYLPEKEFKTLKYQLQHKQLHTSNTIPTNNNESIDFKDMELVLTSSDCPAESLSWIPLDPEDEQDSEKYPEFWKAHPIRCTVKPGNDVFVLCDVLNLDILCICR